MSLSRRTQHLSAAVLTFAAAACSPAPDSTPNTDPSADGGRTTPITISSSIPATTPVDTKTFGTGTSTSVEPEPTTTPPSTLPTVQLDGIQFGYSLSSTSLIEDDAYAEIVRQDATIVTPENDMKWNRIHPGPEEYDFSRADKIVGTAQENGQDVRGHVLVWHEQLPDWLENTEWTRDELIEVMRSHITDVVGYYRTTYPGVITQWDVVNEAFSSDGSRRDTIWQRVIGDDYIALAFRFARQADPDAVLFYNDFFDSSIIAGGDADREHLGASASRSSCEDVPKCAAVRQLADEFVRSGVPIDGIGFEAHIFDFDQADYSEFAAWTAPLGLQWALTEVDVALLADQGDDPEALDRQADSYVSMIENCSTSPNCNTVVVWGVSDGQSWIPKATDGERGHALLYREDYSPKPATARVFAALAAAGAT